MKTLYLDIFSGISGDMFIGAMIDLGVDLAELKSQLNKLGVEGFHVHAQRQSKSGIEGFKFDVNEEGAHGTSTNSNAHEHEHHHHHAHHDHSSSRNYSDIKILIQESTLSDWVKQRSIGVFHRIAVAEGKIHGHPPEEVHFHEVGAIDSIVDIVGACICLEQLGRPRVLAGPVIEGTGFVMCAHGRFPVPTMATLEILGARGIPVSQCEEPHELVTPTGAALLAEFAESFEPMFGLVATSVGYGLGTRDNKTRPNVLRAVLGEADSTTSEAAFDWEADTVAVLETNLDDTNPEWLGHFVQQALSAGALDVFFTAAQMKKNRPGTLLTLVCNEVDSAKFSEMIFRETTAFGLRETTSRRRKLKRKWREVETRYGIIRVKLGLLNGEIVQSSPEFESCRVAAEQHGVPLRDVYRAATSSLSND